jgi:hypothetical protein
MVEDVPVGFEDQLEFAPVRLEKPVVELPPIVPPCVLMVPVLPLPATALPCVFQLLPVVVPPATVAPCVFQPPVDCCAMPPGGTVVRTFCDRVFSHPVNVTPARKTPAKPSTGFLPIGIPLPRKQ